MTQDAEEAAMRAKAHQHGLEYVAPRLIETCRNWADLMPEELARETDTLPQGLAGPALKVLISDPLDFETIDVLRFRLGRPIEVALALQGAIREATDRLYETADL
jgi:hypothetical protein